MKKTLFLIFLLSALIAGAAGIDFSRYGAGPMLNPGRTFYVSTKGSNKNDGKTLQTAFRTIGFGAAKLRAGDTRLIAGGDYFEDEVRLNVKDPSINFTEQCGVPGSPIRIMGMKGEKVRLRGSELLPLGKKQGSVYVFKYDRRLI